MQQIAQPISLISIKPTFPPLISLTHSLKSKIHFQNPIISAKWRKKRSGSQRSHKLIINSIAHIASTLKIIPEPLDSLVREFLVVGGGNGGKFGFRNGFGGGGGGRNRRREVGFWVLLLISSSLALWVVLEKEKDNHELGFWVFLVLVSAFAVFCLVKGWRREIKNWVLGFSCGAALMGLGLRNNENFVRWVDEFRASSLNFSFIKKKRRRGKRWI
ncbi:hypothetical protein SOVF_032810 [Spinacia oleracea]|uniref:Transmembrane protein n=1 Tax=Spinacia oleracea TaxID=3562 RepID=A0ABM3RWA8_SPIOL|nr:uncharacterized protein LOC130472572 [Spinacia oleracea]KNA22580.1 hypothetical protein SOVF_032810 [Spinacia oleracea]